MIKSKILIAGKITNVEFKVLGKGSGSKTYATGLVETLLTGERTIRKIPLLTFFPEAIKYLRSLKNEEEFKGIGILEEIENNNGKRVIISLIKEYNPNLNNNKGPKQLLVPSYNIWEHP